MPATGKLTVGSRIPFVTDKVGYKVGMKEVDVGDDADLQEIVDGLVNASRLPAEKYDQPLSSSQEVGWYTRPLVQPNPRNWHGLQQGEATRFAENYTREMAGAHMFHKSDLR